MPKLNITDTKIASLKPYPRNPRTHSKKQIRQIADSIREFGFTNPILVDRDGRIIAGHGRVEAAKLLGMESVPTICLDELSETQIRAYIIADNKLAENAGWDEELLAIELESISSLDLDFDLTLTGFETAEIDILIQGTVPSPEDSEADAIPEIDPAVPPVSRVGDLWRLGSHRLFCGDAMKSDSFETLMANQKAQMIFIDPPYNVPIDGHVCGLGSVQHENFKMASGEMTEEEFTDFLRIVFRHLADFSSDGSIHFVCMDWRHVFEITTAARAISSETKNLCVWNKDNGGMGSLYRSKHELVFVFKNGNASHINNVQLGSYGRNRTNVWDYPGVNSLRESRLEELQRHPTTKPVTLVADTILDCSNRDGIVLDCFAGSGTTLIAGEKTGRKAFAMEIESKYVDTAILRWQEYTGKQAIHSETGKSFGELQAERCAEKEVRHDG